MYTLHLPLVISKKEGKEHEADGNTNREWWINSKEFSEMYNGYTWERENNKLMVKS